MSAALFYCAPPPPPPEPLCGSTPRLDVIERTGDGASPSVEDEQLIGVDSHDR